jgi:uncharacterized membrane protein
MIKIETSVQINRPLEEVFAFVTDIDNLPQWAGPVTEAKQISEGPIGVGTTQTQSAQFLGRQMETTQEVTEYVLNKTVATKSTSGPLPMAIHYFFEPVGNGTKVKFEAELDAKGFFKLAEPIAGRMLQRQTAADAETLKEILETGV